MKKAVTNFTKFDPATVKARDWIVQFKLVMKMEGASDGQIVQAMPLCFQGDATRWHQGEVNKCALKENDPSFDDLTSYSEKFINMFDPPPNQMAAAAALQTCRIRPSESINQHLLRFRRCEADMSEPFSVSMMRTTYVGMLRAETRAFINQQFWSQLNNVTDTTPYTTLAQNAMQYEQMNESESKGDYPPSPVTRAVSTPSLPSPPASRPAPFPYSAPSTSPSRPLPQGQSPQVTGSNYRGKRPLDNYPGQAGQHASRSPPDLSKVTCFRCQQKGHYANKCPLASAGTRERITLNPHVQME
jgi:hypothetical protein